MKRIRNYWPTATYYGVPPPFDWHWKSGVARLHLEYQSQGRTFAQEFVLVRERERRR